jgi:hypothetical protein
LLHGSIHHRRVLIDDDLECFVGFRHARFSRQEDLAEVVVALAGGEDAAGWLTR